MLLDGGNSLVFLCTSRGSCLQEITGQSIFASQISRDNGHGLCIGEVSVGSAEDGRYRELVSHPAID